MTCATVRIGDDQSGGVPPSPGPLAHPSEPS